MVCSLKPEKQRNLRVLVARKIMDVVEQDQPFNLRDYTRSVYDMILDRTQDRGKALDYAMLVPLFVDQLASLDIQRKTALRKKGVSFDELADLLSALDNNETTLSTIEGYINVSDSLVQEMREKAEEIKPVEEDALPVVTEPEEHVVQGQLPSSRIDVEPTAVKDETLTALTFHAQPPTMFADIAFEALTAERTSEKYNVKDESAFKQLQFKVKRNILKELSKPDVAYDSSKLKMGFTEGLYLTMMSSTKIPADSLDPSAPADSHEQGVSLVLTNTYGEILRFDSVTGEPNYEGKAVYFNVRNTDSIVSPEGKVTKLSQEDLRKVDSLANRIKKGKVPTAQEREGAKQQIEKEIELIHQMRQSILANKDTTFKNEITGGSLGYTLFDYSINNKVSDINFDGQIFAPRRATDTEVSQGLKSTSHYFILDSMYGRPIELERGLMKDSGLTDVLSSVIVDPITIEDNLGNLVPLTKEARKQIVETYFYTSADTIQLFENKEGQRTLTITGFVYPLNTPEERTKAKSALLKYFNELGPRRRFVKRDRTGKEVKISANDLRNKTVIKTSDPDYKNKYRVGNILEVVGAVDPGTGERAESSFYIIEYPKINISDAAINSGTFDLIESVIPYTDGTSTLTFKKNASYSEFLKNNTFIHYELNAQGKLERLNSYLTFSPVPEDINKLFGPAEEAILKTAEDTSVPTSTLTDTSSLDQNIDDLLNDIWSNPELHKNLDQKSVNRRATNKQIEDAKKWYEASPLSSYFPFETLFNVVNTKTPRAAATWTMNGITLYKGADYSDLYHEAWHGFSQGFLSREDKVKLYNETRKKGGTFTDYNGKSVYFNQATDLQIEEYLAEDFRVYMLKGQSTSDGPVRNNIFRRIFEFLKTLFKGMTVKEVVENDRANDLINELYEKLRVGNLSEYTFSQENASFGELNTGIRPFDKTSTVPPLNYQDSMSIVKTVDALLSEFIDRLNAGITTAEMGELAQVQGKLSAGRLSVEERKMLEARLKTLESKRTYQYTSTKLKTQLGLKQAYKYVQIRLGAIHNELVQKMENTKDSVEKEQLLKSIQTLHYAFKNFGDINNLQNNNIDADNNVLGVIGYHAYKSSILESGDVAVIFEEDNIVEDENFIASREGINRLGNATSMKDLAKPEIITLLSTLYKVDKKGNPVLNQYGVPELTDFKEVWNRLVRMLAGHTADKMEELLKAEAKDYPAIYQLLNKLGPLQTNSSTEHALWTSFYRTFNPTKVPLIQVTVNKNVRELKIDVENTPVFAEVSYETNIGEATGEYKKVGREWERDFKIDESNPYTVSDDSGRFLNINKILEDFPADKLAGMRWEFFNAIGFKLSDVPEIRQALNEKNVGGAKYYRDKLIYLKENNISVRRFSDLNKEYVYAKGISDSLDSRFSDLQELEVRYSDRKANFMVNTATGNTQSEYTLNSTLTQLVNKINAAESYQALISQPETNHYDLNRNPLIKGSTWMNSLFKMDVPKADPEYGKRRRTSNSPEAPFVKLELSNLSGVLFTINGETTGNGIESAQADPFTKLIMDFHLMIQSSHPELLRHGDKSTSYSVVLSHVFANGKFKDNYIPNMSFFKGSYQNEALGLLLPHISGELERVQIMRNPSQYSIDKDFDANYRKRGSEFVFFDTMLSPSTKEVLYGIRGNLMDYLENNNEETRRIRLLINTDIENYFNEQTESLNRRFNEAGFIATRLYNQISGTADNVTGEKFPREKVQITLIRSLVYNTWIHNIESMSVLYGDIAQYNVAKDEVHKRISGIGSTGLLARTDQFNKDYINQVVTRDYAKKLGVENIKAYDGTFSSAIIQDRKTTSAYIKEQEALLGKEGASKYRDMDEGDAMGWISFDSYRILKISQGQWLPQHEEMYQDIVNGKRIDREYVKDIFFPTMKAQYFGPLKTTGLPLVAFHKFQLFPLIPSVIENSPRLRELHDKMTNEQVDYVLFKSGSKVSTLTSGDKVEEVYDANRVLSTNPFTKNEVFIDYLKDQLEIGSVFKGKVTFPTQLRTLVEEGLMENGIPTDYKGSETEWNNLSANDKEKDSDNYKLLRAFEKNIDTLTQLKKKELLKKANWTIDKTGKLEGNLDDLIKFLKKELSRLDMGDHEIDFLQTHNGNIKFDLSIAPFAEKIEKLLNNIVTKELINQKMTGEALVQVSGAMFENNQSIGRDYKNPTEDDLRKWGSNDLPFYHKGKDGKTAPMKVKIAMQGQFKKLLQLKGKDGYELYSIEKLNEALKDEEWLNTGDHRRMITMVGVRIPVQGLNSMEFMEVYEFLPEVAGNIIIPPAEIVAKSGSDFDIDKLTVLMPSFRRTEEGNVVPYYQVNREDARKLYEKYTKYKIEKAKEVKSAKRPSEFEPISAYDNLLYSIFKISAEELDEELFMMLQEEGKALDFDQFFDRLNGVKSVENDLLWNIKSILELPSNYANLIRPNDINIAKAVADEMAMLIPELGGGKSIKGSNVLGYEFNLNKHNSNNSGKSTLSIGAVGNKWNPLFNRVGAYLNPTAGLTTEAYNKIVAKGKNASAAEKKLASRYRRQKLFLPHHTKQLGNETGISLSGLWDVNNENRISDVISQMMNGWLDVAKDDWIFYIQGNEQITPSLEFMIEAGVPFKTAVYLVSIPMVRDYVKEQQLASSTFADALNKAPMAPSMVRNKARVEIFNNPRYGFDMLLDEKNVNFVAAKEAEDRVEKALGSDKFFDAQKLRELSASTTDNINDYQRAAFLHFLEIEDMAGAMRDIKLRMNTDTSKSGNLYEAQNKITLVKELMEDARIPSDVLKKILEESPISSFFIQEFQLNIWSPLFTLRTHPIVTAFLQQNTKNADVANTFKDREMFNNEFRNDLISYIFQNSIGAFGLNSLAEYRGLPVEENTDAKNPVIVKDGVIKLNKAALINRYKALDFGIGLGLAFPTSREFFRFAIEKEYLRFTHPFETIKDSVEYKFKRDQIIDDISQLKDETQEVFKERREQLIYDIFLRDKALDNTNNMWKLFSSKDTYATQFMALRRKFPQLSTNYDVVRQLSLGEGAGKTNLRLNDTKLDADMINLYHENLLNLADPQIKKVQDPEANQLISEFFGRFSTVAYLQSGLSTKNAYSLGRIVPPQHLVMLINEASKDYVKHFNQALEKSETPAVMQDFYSKFVRNNSNFISRIRGKNYASEMSLNQSIKRLNEKPVVPKTQAPPSPPMQGPLDASAEDIQDLPCF